VDVTTTIGIECRDRTRDDFTERRIADECLDLLDAHGVVVYRDAHISDDNLVRFTRMLGEVVVAPVGGLAEHPEISPVTLDRTRSPLAAYRRSTFFWHLDGAQDDVPQKATLLAAREVADAGGDTEFASTVAAYEALASDERAEIDHLRVVHSIAASQLLMHPKPSPQQRAAWDQTPSREHPLVWQRADGRRSLLIGASAGEIVGRSPEESRALLNRLLAWSTQPRFVLRHRWNVGDLVVWDNIGMLHRALPYEPTSRRLLHRTTVQGERVSV
jgi:alpha-ketoglutarate-dependent taurine dioxygenase